MLAVAVNILANKTYCDAVVSMSMQTTSREIEAVTADAVDLHVD